MISTSEELYCKSLLQTCANEGYPYYVLREVYNNDSVDVELYVSQSEITLHSDVSWTLDDGLLYRIDSSATNYSSPTGDVITVSAFSGSGSAYRYESVFSNAQSESILVPDILAGEVDRNETVENMGAALVLCVLCIGFTALFRKLFGA